jgi:hypothetical protein
MHREARVVASCEVVPFQRMHREARVVASCEVVPFQRMHREARVVASCEVVPFQNLGTSGDPHFAHFKVVNPSCPGTVQNPHEKASS